MTKNNWAFQDEISNSPSLPVVYITSTNSSLLNMNSYIMIVSEFWNFSVLDGNILDRMEDKGGVLGSVGGGVGIGMN